MAVNHTPPDPTKPAGSRLKNSLDRVESGAADLLEEIATFMETIDGGEVNLSDETKLTRTVAVYGFVDAAAAKAAGGQLQAVRQIFTNGSNAAALAQACNRLR